MTRFYPLSGDNVGGLWTHVPGPRMVGARSVLNLPRWEAIARERDENRRITEIWRDAAIADGWLVSPTYASEALTSACTLYNEDGFHVNIITRPSKAPDMSDPVHYGHPTLGGGSIHAWGPDRLQVPVPREYPGLQYFKDALVTCPHCHRGPNGPLFASSASEAEEWPLHLREPVATLRYSFAGRACNDCAPRLRAVHEKPGWND